LQRTHPILSIGSKTHVSGHFGPFHYFTKVDAKLDHVGPLTHKFAKQSGFEIFHTEGTQSTQLDPKSHVLGHFGPFCYCTKVVAKLAG
jgi:hypothetical protein